jgi:hypothetical protein
MGNLMSHPKSLTVFKELTNHPNVMLCETIIPYSFLVIDGETVGVEVVNPEDPYSFFFGLRFRNTALATKMISHFEAFAKNSDKDSIAEAIASPDASLEKQPQPTINY